MSEDDRERFDEIVELIDDLEEYERPPTSEALLNPRLIRCTGRFCFGGSRAPPSTRSPRGHLINRTGAARVKWRNRTKLKQSEVEISIRLIFAVAWLSLLALPGFAAVVERKPDPVHGKELAESLCVNCHLVDSRQKEANVDVPSFREIANEEGQTEGTVMAHIFLPKHPMPQISLTASELADLAAYIMQLRDR